MCVKLITFRSCLNINVSAPFVKCLVLKNKWEQNAKKSWCTRRQVWCKQHVQKGLGPRSCTGRGLGPSPLNRQTDPNEDIIFLQVHWRMEKRFLLGITGRQTATEVGGKTKVLQILIPFVYLQKNKCPSLVPSSIRSYVAILQTAGPGRMVFHFLTTMVLQNIAQDRT